MSVKRIVLGDKDKNRATGTKNEKTELGIYPQILFKQDFYAFDARL